MKTTLSKIALIVISVMSLSVHAANTVDSKYTGTKVLAGDNNSVTGDTPRGSGELGGSQVIVGQNNMLTGTDSSQIFGSGNIIDKSDLTLTGQGNNVTGLYGNVYGDVNTVNTGGSFVGANVFGNGSKINGAGNNIFGDGSSITGRDSSIFGSGSTVSSDYSNVVGSKNTVASGAYAVIIGNGSTNTGQATDTGGISIGSNNTLTNAKDGTVIGNLSSAEGQNSLVIGSAARATNGAVAIGSGSVGSRSNTVSFGNTGSERQLTNVAAGTADTDVSNVKQMRDADTATLNSANLFTSTREQAINTRTDSLLATEQLARTTGDADTLSSAKGYTDARETVINSRVDNLLFQEKSDRITGDADTLAKSGNYTDKQTAAAISTANNYTDTREQAINSRTDGLVADEASKRIAGDADTLRSANTYTNNREDVINNRTDTLVNAEQQSRIDGDRRTLNSANTYTNKKFSELDNKVNRNERRANGGISGAMAMSSIPYLNYVDNSLGMATSTYRGETAIAAGLQSQVSAMTNVRLNASWDTGGGVGIAAGMAVGW
ncbi:YadA-like family protein [Pantoea agglomerans]|uniref:YadA-like family protein n=1 Tax=Enterobacter agglomerans TaxID=549 RepID=UPI00390A7D77